MDTTMARILTWPRRRMLRAAVWMRWAYRDALHAFEPSSGVLTCLACGGSFPRAEMRQLVSHCAFGGGRLVRHECPSCGAIFGPQKVLMLSPEQLEEDYRRTYAWYEEGDTTEYELKAFNCLGPRMDGFYLNYGAGRWSRMLSLARQMGYNIIGYEPFVASDSPYVISSAEELNTRRFDGIMSNNLIEHLTDPAGTLSFMRSLLAEGGVMAHSTACYEYSYEYSRFHVIFFTGKALDAVCRRSRLTWTATDDPNVRVFRPI